MKLSERGGGILKVRKASRLGPSMTHIRSYYKGENETGQMYGSAIPEHAGELCCIGITLSASVGNPDVAALVHVSAAAQSRLRNADI